MGSFSRSPRCRPLAVALGATVWLAGWIVADARGEVPFPVPLSVAEPSGIERVSEPVSGGVPLPREAAILDVDSLRLVDGGGNPVPAQMTVLARWGGAPGDASLPIRWVFVDFQASLAPHETASFSLEAGPPPDPGPPMSVTDNAGAVTVDTGRAVFRIRKDRFNFLDGVSLDLDGDGTADDVVVSPGHFGGIEITPTGGKAPYSSSLDGAPTVTVVAQGPLRTVLKATGVLNSNSHNEIIPDQYRYLEYTAYYSFYRNHEFTRVELSLRYPERVFEFDMHNQGRELAHELLDLTLWLPVNLGGARSISIQGDTTWQATLASGETARVYQDSSGGDAWAPPPGGEDQPYWSTTFRGYRIYRGTGDLPMDVAASGNRARGITDVWDSTKGLTVGLRDFWQNFPKGIRVQGDGKVVVELCPPQWRTYHRIRGGIQKTYDLLLHFHSRPPGDPVVQGVAASLDAPLLLLAPNTVYRDSMAIGFLPTEEESLTWHYDTAAHAVIDYQGGIVSQGDIYDERDAEDAYGWLNYGDTFRAGNKSATGRYWGNNEFDFSYCMLAAWLRDPNHDRRFFDNGLAMVRHLYDTDLYHTERDLFWANHGIRKHDADGIQDHSRAPFLSHHWIQGLKLEYWLTGDPMARSALMEVGQWLTGLEDPPGSGDIAFAGEVRSKGWMILSLLDLFEVTGDTQYLDLIRRMIPVEVVGPLQPGGYIVNSSSLVNPWMMSYVTEALGKYLLLLRTRGESDATALEALTRILGFLRNEAWVPSQNMMCYAWDPVTQTPVDFSANLSNTSADGFYFGFLLTGWVGYLESGALAYDSIHNTTYYPYYYSDSFETPAKNAGFRLRFGLAEMYHRQKVFHDLTPPVISNLRADEIRADSAVIRFHTDDESGTVLFFWEDGGAIHWRKKFQYYLLDHAVSLEGLTPERTVFYAVTSFDLAGNQSWSALQSFTTQPAVGINPQGNRSR